MITMDGDLGFDYIMCSNVLKKFKKIYSPDFEIYSDHLPVILEVDKWKRKWFIIQR